MIIIIYLSFFCGTVFSQSGSQCPPDPCSSTTCQYGRVIENGCLTCYCEMSPCQGFECPSGSICNVVKDANNMYKATCGPKVAEKLCANITCSNYCNYGTLSDSNGCPTCNCREPCKDYPCPEGQNCKVVNVNCPPNGCIDPPMATCTACNKVPDFTNQCNSSSSVIRWYSLIHLKNSCFRFLDFGCHGSAGSFATESECLATCQEAEGCVVPQCSADLSCQYGRKVDKKGCFTCQCRDPCEYNPCKADEICRVNTPECNDGGSCPAGEEKSCGYNCPDLVCPYGMDLSTTACKCKDPCGESSTAQHMSSTCASNLLCRRVSTENYVSRVFHSSCEAYIKYWIITITKSITKLEFEIFQSNAMLNTELLKKYLNSEKYSLNYGNFDIYKIRVSNDTKLLTNKIVELSILLRAVNTQEVFYYDYDLQPHLLSEFNSRYPGVTIKLVSSFNNTPPTPSPTPQTPTSTIVTPTSTAQVYTTTPFPATVSKSVPNSVSTTVPLSVPNTVSTTVPISVPNTVSTTVPKSVPNTVSNNVPTTVPKSAANPIMDPVPNPDEWDIQKPHMRTLDMKYLTAVIVLGILVPLLLIALIVTWCLCYRISKANSNRNDFGSTKSEEMIIKPSSKETGSTKKPYTVA